MGGRRGFVCSVWIRKEPKTVANSEIFIGASCFKTASDINGKSTPSTKTEEDVDDYLQDWATVSYVVDDSFLASGTHDAEFIERWRKLKDNKDDSFYLQTILSRGKALRESKNVPDVVKARPVSFPFPAVIKFFVKNLWQEYC